jgi:transcriptional regulator with XRE-family HTH domain
MRRAEMQEGLGQAIRELRRNRGMLALELARDADINVSLLARLERGQVNPSWGTMRRIAWALGIAASELAAVAEEFEPETL